MRQGFLEGDLSIRDQFLDGSVYPRVRATARKSRLDFGGEFHVDSVALAGNMVGDDYYDQSVGPTVWGDAQMHNLSPYPVLQLITPAAWTSGGSDILYKRVVELEGSESWSYSQITTPGSVSLKGYSKIGIYPRPGGWNYWFVYYFDTDGDINIVTFDSSTNAWGTPITYDLSIGEQQSVAIYPYDYGATYDDHYMLLVASDPPFITYGLLTYIGDPVDNWRYLSLYRRDLCSAMNVVDTQWSGSGVASGGNDWGWSHDEDNRALIVNMGDRAMALIYDADSTHGGSDPFEILPSSEWGNMRCRVSGVNTINGRMWATVDRWALGTDDIPYARHTALASSGNGADWRDEGYVLDAPIRGKPFMRPDGEYLYIVGNASVVRAPACAQVGADPASMKYEMYELDSANISFSGPGSVHTMKLKAKQVDDSGLAEFLEPGNEITVEIGTGNEFANYAMGTVVDVTTSQDQNDSYWDITCLGKMSRAIGALSYKPMGARMYEGPYSMYSLFTFHDNQLPKLTFMPESGEWVNQGISFFGERYSLHCKRPGRAILPHLMHATSFMVRTTFMPTVSIEGIYLMLWHKDENNYAKVGFRRSTTPWYWGFYIKVVQDGVEEEISPEGSTNMNHLPVNMWYTMMVTVAGPSIRVELHPGGPADTEDTYDGPGSPGWWDWFHTYGSFSLTSGSFTLQPDFPPASYSIGLEVEDFALGTWEGSLAYGTVDSSGADYITDDSQNFPNEIVGQWLIVGGVERQVISKTADTIKVAPNFPAPPEPGAAYSVYPRFQDAPMLPGCIFSDFFVYTGEHPWTVGLVLGNMLELAGLTPDESVRPIINLVPLAQATEEHFVHGNIDAVIEAAGPGYTSNPVIMYLWATSTEVDNEYQFSALKLEVWSDYTYLYYVQSLGAVSSPYSTERLIAKHRNMIRLSNPDVGINNTIRVLANDDYVAVYAGAQLLSAFPLQDSMPGGYVSVESALSVGGQAWLMEFSEVVESFIWDSSSELSGALSRLLQGRRVKFVENENGEIGVSRFEGDWGEVDYDETLIVAITEYDEGVTIQNRPAIIGVEGATDLVYVLDRELARQGISNYERVDNPSIIGGPLDAMRDARRELLVRKGKAHPRNYKLYAPDPSLMIEDWWTDGEGVSHTIQSMQMSMKGGVESSALSFTMLTRQRGEAPNIGIFDTDDYDSGKEFG